MAAVHAISLERRRYARPVKRGVKTATSTHKSTGIDTRIPRPLLTFGMATRQPLSFF